MFDAEIYYERLVKYGKVIKEKVDFEPELAIVLGSGLGDFADNIEVVGQVAYKELDGFPVSTAPGHEGSYIFGMLDGIKVVALKGRIHYYEGYDMEEVVLPLRVAHILGAKSAIITNAVGGINENFNVGGFMVAEDCITAFIPSPLRGPNIDRLGERFVDVSQIYDKGLIVTAEGVAKEKGIDLNKGVLLQAMGPHFETAADIRLYKMLGADAVGMSSVVEAIACRHMGMRVLNLSCITNMGTGISKTELSGEEVMEIANKVSVDFAKLVRGSIKGI